MIKFESEETLEDFIFDNIDILPEEVSLKDPHRKIYRQFNIAPYGIIDILILSYDSSGPPRASIIELKNVEISSSAIKQISRYKTGVEKFLERLGVDDYIVSGALLCKHVEAPSECVYVTDHTEWLTYYHFKLCPYDGIKIDSASDHYVTTEEDNKPNKLLLDFATEVNCGDDNED